MNDSNILATYAPASQNSERAIVKQRMEAMRERPNDRNAQKLDDLGFSVDHDDYFDHDGEWGEYVHDLFRSK